MKLYVMNDTSVQLHAGCRAVMEILYKLLEDHEILCIHRVNDLEVDEASFMECDAVVVNGEDSMHSARPNANFILDTMVIAQKMGKKTAIVNAVWQNAISYKDKYGAMLKKLDLFTVRETASRENARLCGGDPQVFPDLCIDTQLSTLPPKYEGELVIGGAGATVHHSKFFAALGEHRLSLNVGKPLAACVAALRGAQGYVTGQHHGVYTAVLANVPFVAVPSNTHKIQGLIQWSGFPIRVNQTEAGIKSSIQGLDHSRSIFSEFNVWLMEQPRLTKQIINSSLT